MEFHSIENPLGIAAEISGEYVQREIGIMSSDRGGAVLTKIGCKTWIALDLSKAERTHCAELLMHLEIREIEVAHFGPNRSKGFRTINRII